MEPVIHLNYQVDKAFLLSEADKVKSSAVSYTDSRYPHLKMENWLIAHYNSEYSEKIMSDFGVRGKPRFYWLKPFAVIPEHVDNRTLCGLNFVLTENASPISFGDKNYYYSSILINTTLPHKVKNNEDERIMFKISIFDESFESVSEKIKKYII